MEGDIAHVVSVCMSWKQIQEPIPRALSAVTLAAVCYSSSKHSVLWTSVGRAEFGIPVGDLDNNIICASAVQTTFIKT